MVNYCCVPGCMRNSGKNPNLTFFSLPKDPLRQLKWLKAAGREDLMSPEMEKTRLIKRFCSRHFTTLQMTKRHMQSDAIPTLHLPGGTSLMEPESKQELHAGIACNVCSQQVFGFRYMCLSCPDFDLCHKCEANEAHPDHLVVRLPKPVHFTKARKIARKCQRVFGADPIAITDQSSDRSESDDQSDDSEDEPITKYRSDDLELSVSVRMAIQAEIERALKVPKPEEKPSKPVRRRKYLDALGATKLSSLKTISHAYCQTDDLPDDALIDFEVALKQEMSQCQTESRGQNSDAQCQTGRVYDKMETVELSVAKLENGATVEAFAPAESLATAELDRAALAELSEFIIIPQKQ